MQLGKGVVSWPQGPGLSYPAQALCRSYTRAAQSLKDDTHVMQCPAVAALLVSQQRCRTADLVSDTLNKSAIAWCRQPVLFLFAQKLLICHSLQRCASCPQLASRPQSLLANTGMSGLSHSVSSPRLCQTGWLQWLSMVGKITPTVQTCAP